MHHQQLYDLIRREGFHPDPIAHTILMACAHTGLHLSDALALLEKESRFQNLFGSDVVRNPIKGGRVTRARYIRYKFFRRIGLGMQGVGYCQLTWFGFQDQADALGGCWRGYPNMIVGFTTLKHLIDAHGREKGAAMYNGTGPRADAYGRDFVRVQAKWHRLVT